MEMSLSLKLHQGQTQLAVDPGLALALNQMQTAQLQLHILRVIYLTDQMQLPLSSLAMASLERLPRTLKGKGRQGTARYRAFQSSTPTLSMFLTLALCLWYTCHPLVSPVLLSPVGKPCCMGLLLQCCVSLQRLQTAVMICVRHQAAVVL